jgi:hypothetical protein
MKTIPLVTAILLVCLLFPAVARAQNYSIDWFTIGGGGGISTGGVYSVSGTIGQPTAGPLSGGSYSLLSGFWSIVAAIQNDDGPLLEVTKGMAAGSITVSWPIEGGSGFILEETSSLNTSSGWMLVEPATYQSNTTTHFITIAGPVSGTRLYRLKKP